MIEQVGPYEVIRELGRGGMGVVYLARDKRLNREVAIKVLPPELASDPVRLERFEREARTLAQLNHPNLAGIHGVEEQDRSRYLVLEYVNGESLADRLDRGLVPIDEAIEYAVQIAAGLEAAHDVGVIHRDLKPDNVMITQEGQAKVLDFGLARTDEGGQSSSGGLDSPTITTPQPQHSPTIAGAILGTAAYMSPEQARGRRVDKRTDIWSFGIILYELLTGTSPFAGDTATDSIGAVLHKDVDLALLPEGTPRMVRHVLSRCFERDKSARLQSIGDARVELSDALRRLKAGESDDDLIRTSPAGRWAWPATITALALIGAVSTALWLAPWSTATTAALGPRVVGIQKVTDFGGPEQSAALSPDGDAVVYTTWQNDSTDIWRLRLGGQNPTNLTRTPFLERRPTFSPDGQSIAYVADVDSIFVMGATGENPRFVGNGYDPAWSPDGRSIVCSTMPYWRPNDRMPSGLAVIDIATGQRRELDTRDPAAEDKNLFASDAVAPALSPDGRRIAFSGWQNGTGSIYTMDSDGGDVVRVTSGAHSDMYPMWGPDSNWVMFLSNRGNGQGLWLLEIDASGCGKGEPRPVMMSPTAITKASLSADGRSLLLDAYAFRRTIGRVGFDTEQERFLPNRKTVYQISTPITNIEVSSDGEWIAFESAPPEKQIVVISNDGTNRRMLTTSSTQARYPQWLIDGESVLYSLMGPTAELRQVSLQGAQTSQFELSNLEEFTFLPTLSLDKSKLAVRSLDSTLIYEANAQGEFQAAGRLPDWLLIPIAWSPSNRHFLAAGELPNEALPEQGWALVSYDLSNDRFVPLKAPDGRLMRDNRDGLYIDDTRLMYWDERDRMFFILDLETEQSRWVEGFHPEARVQPHALIDGDTIYFSYEEHDSDLWLITLDFGE